MKKRILVGILTILILLSTLVSTIYAVDENTDYSNLPSSFDLRDKINIRVENQGQRGWCGAYATTKVLETHILLTRGIDCNLSEAYISYLEAPYFGGNVKWKTDITTARALVSNYLSVKHVLESDIPNKDYEFNEINKNKFENAPVFVKNYELKLFTGQGENNINEIKSYIMNSGSVYLSINVDNKYYNSSTSAIYCNEKRDTTVIELETREQVLKYVDETKNHAVTIIGWDDNYSKDNFNSNNKPNKDGAWLILNSWGANWGNNGTAWISYEDEYYLSDILWGIDNVKLRGELPVIEFSYSQRNGYVQGVIKSDEELQSIEGWETTDDNKTFVKSFNENVVPYTFTVYSNIDDTTATVEVNIEGANFTFYDKEDRIHIEGKNKITSEDLKVIIKIIIPILVIFLIIIKFHRKKYKK